MSYSSFAEKLKADPRIILPIGSTEQHGPDAVLGVDHLTATGIAYSLAEATGIPCAPPLNYGMAIHHLGFPGSVALRPITYINVIIDMLRSFKLHGVKEVIVINGHGGNKGPFLNAMQERYDEFSDIKVHFFNWWVMPNLKKEIIEAEFGEKEGYHATPTEISLTMALVPDSMTMPESYTCPQKTVATENCNWVKPANFKDYYPDGVMKADYSGANAKLGKKILEYSLLEICEALER
jgi:creatinine amidohydrolase